MSACQRQSPDGYVLHGNIFQPLVVGVLVLQARRRDGALAGKEKLRERGAPTLLLA